ncbi:hypothetical protein [Streptomyces flavidovirens]|uniref:hypothetical protein n=1 Tax=Streptomyces flavidovirens TaxID=67298 RepID=UPI00041876C8|nr:hypothetical protein [Streptomyces flavidovirens]
MLRITAAVKALLLAVFALLSLTVATGNAVAVASAVGHAAVAEPETAPPVIGQGSCLPADADTQAHPGQARRGQRPETYAPQAAVHVACALASPPAELARHTLPADDNAPYCHAPSRSGDLPIALQRFRC